MLYSCFCYFQSFLHNELTKYHISVTKYYISFLLVRWFSDQDGGYCDIVGLAYFLQNADVPLKIEGCRRVNFTFIDSSREIVRTT